MWDGNVIDTILTIICWGIVASGIVYLYNRRRTKAQLGKSIIIFYVGLFSFSLPITYFEESLQIAILPLGVWLLFFILNRRGRWLVYRPYAWLGFFANYLFLAAALITAPLHEAVYPPDELVTYIADDSEITVMLIHEKAPWPVTMKDTVLQANHTQMASMTWYNDTALTEKGLQQERFPYLVVGAQSKWGSGYKPTIYLEQDGRGLLVTAKNNHHYFRTEQVILEGVK